ncbi:MAG TPA: hypothetical protein VEL79_22595 [Vicinamibacterales bacterium]|nr:hypothetical protein [Vicinamibacterales bacterium]
MTTSPLDGLNWFWISVELTVPSIVGVLLAIPLWIHDQPVLGNVAGAIVMFGTAFGLILREHVELDRLSQACLDAGSICFPHPAAFTRFAVYAFIALFEVIALFMLSLTVDERRRRRGYDPQWR